LGPISKNVGDIDEDVCLMSLIWTKKAATYVAALISCCYF